jgi:hypothetical protein
MMRPVAIFQNAMDPAEAVHHVVVQGVPLHPFEQRFALLDQA